MRLDTVGRRLYCDAAAVELSAREFAVLELLLADTETEAAAKRADAGPQGPPVALAAVKAAAGRVPVVVRPAASASAKPGKPAAAAPTTDPGGFIKVRE